MGTHETISIYIKYLQHKIIKITKTIYLTPIDELVDQLDTNLERSTFKTKLIFYLPKEGIIIKDPFKSDDTQSKYTCFIIDQII